VRYDSLFRDNLTSCRLVFEGLGVLRKVKFLYGLCLEEFYQKGIMLNFSVIEAS